jgi:uncharacterized protein (PEP-CTERM system associated)
MAITRIEQRGSLALDASSPRDWGRRRKRVLQPIHVALLLAACQGITSTAAAQAWKLEPSATARMTATNNSGFANSVDTGGDVLLELAPRFEITGRGPRFSLTGDVEARSFTYARSTLTNDFVPAARLALNANPVERWLYLDASTGLQQTRSNPYSAISQGTVPAVRLQTAQYRLSPYLDHAFTPSLSIRYRDDNLWNRRSSDSTRNDSDVRGQSFALVHRPTPFGFSLEANRERTKYLNATDSIVEFQTARGVLTYAADPTLVLGAVVGAERSEIAQSSSRDTIRGFRLRWLPSERSDLDLSVERRFFNNGWNAAWSHRSPFMAMQVTLTRQPTSQPSSFLLPSTGGDLRNLIDAAFTTRYPNPAERSVVVENAIASLGALPSVAGGSIEVISDYVQLQQRAAVSVVFLSPRSALTVQAYSLDSKQLQRPNASLTPVLPPTVADNKQLGASVGMNRRLTTTMSVDALLSGVKIDGTGDSRGRASRSKSAQLSANQALSPKTRLTVGARRQLSSSTETRPVQETAAFLGIEHKF